MGTRSSSNRVDGEMESSSYMLKVDQAWKSYDGKNFIFKDLRMNVVQGQIYSLLGSSGVGKTTLLQSIVGNTCLDYGEVDLNVTSRLDIGYMPQELALYTDLTIEETFIFFGKVLHMTRKTIKKKLDNLTDLLNLPPSQKQISRISGGEQRRVSLAVALMNCPKFLILDEPTASLDSLLKQSIWEHLKHLTQVEKKTVLLTTHYLEEASNSDKVGFLSGGKILLEGSPEGVKQCCDPPLSSLEEVHYHLSLIDQTQEEIKKMPKKETAVAPLPLQTNFSMRRVEAFSLKTLFYIRRNILTFYVFIFTPALLTILATAVYDRPRGMSIGYLNFESNCTNEILNCSTPLSCRYLRKLNEHDFTLIKMANLEDGKAAVADNKVWGLVRFNHNFSDGAINRLDYFYSDHHVEISDEDEARVWLDMSSFPISHVVKNHFYESFLRSIEEWYDDCGWNRKAARPIIRFEEPVYGKIEQSVKSSGVPTVIIHIIFATSAFLGLLFVLTEKELGTLNRCKVNGLKTYELLVSIFSTCLACLIPTGAVMLLILYQYSGPSNGPLLWSLIIFYLQIINGILFGMLAGLYSPSVADALQITNSFAYSFTFLSGILWPIEAIHWIGKICFYLSPPGVPGYSFATISNRGFDLQAYYGTTYSLIWTALLILSLIVSLKTKFK